MSGARPGRAGRKPGGPVLVLAAHGSRDPAAQRVVRQLAGRTAALAALPVVAGFAQHARPAVAEAVREAVRRSAGGGPVVVVPLLLAGGYHLTTDIIPAATRCRARLTAPIGPDPLLCDALADRLSQARVPAGAPVVLAAAGSSEPSALARVREQAALLAARRGAPVQAAFATNGLPTVGSALARLGGRAGRDVAVASYVLAPGFFHNRLSRSGARWVTEPLGGHPAVTAVIRERWRSVSMCPLAVSMCL